MYSDSCLLENLNWISDKKYTECTAKFRYRQLESKVKIEFYDNKAKVLFDNKVKSVTPGQICVFYNGDECLGSGVIKEVFKNNDKIWYL